MAIKLTELQIKGFRTLVDVSIPMRDLAVIIGANGAGKTSLLEAFVFLRRAAHDALPDAVQRFGGINSILSKVIDTPRTLEMVVGASQQEEQSAYRLALSQQASSDYRVEGEFYIPSNDEGVLAWEREKNLRDSTQKNGHLALGQSDQKRGVAFIVALRQLLRQIQFVTPILVQRNAPIRIPQTLTPGTDPGLNGESLFSALYNLNVSHPDIYERILNLLQVAFPTFQSMKLLPVGGGQVTLAWRNAGLSTDLYPLELSEGTLRFLWLITLLLTPEPPPLLLLDEPELSLHPALLQIIAGLLENASLRGQVMVATQSADLIRWLKPNQILIADKEEERTTFKWGDTHPNIQKWLETYTLAELWQMGELGGRP